jgi:lysophospholipase L1-like esterase
MLECLILGDSLGVGISQIRTECVAYVKTGINSYNWVNKNINNKLEAKTVIISLGSNDTDKINTKEELITIRQLSKADKVFWILPNIRETKRKIVWEVANQFGDIVIDARNYERSPDHIHPTYNGYKQIAKNTY